MNQSLAVIGSEAAIVGYGLAGARLCFAEDAAQARAAWAMLLPEQALVILTPQAARWLKAELVRDGHPMVAVLP